MSGKFSGNLLTKEDRLSGMQCVCAWLVWGLWKTKNDEQYLSKNIECFVEKIIHLFERYL